MSAALATTPRPAVEALLLVMQELDALQRLNPGLSGRLRLRLARVRRDWGAGRLTDGQLRLAVDDIVRTGRGIIPTG